MRKNVKNSVSPPMTEVNRDELTTLMSLEYCILVTEDLSGHRLDWLVRFVKEAAARRIRVAVLGVDLSLINTIEEDMQMNVHLCQDFESKLSIIKYLNLLPVKSRIVFWDGDRWLKNLFKLKKQARVLILRPYKSGPDFVSGVRFVLKHIVITVLRFAHGHRFGYLEVPFAPKIFLRKGWVSDEVIIPEIKFKKKLDKEIQPKIFKLLLTGFIDHRKNPDLVVEAVRYLNSKDFGTKFLLSINGKIERDILERLLKLNFDFISISNQYLKSNEYWENLHGADLVLLPYTNRGSSGIAIQSVGIGTRILIPNFRLWSNSVVLSDGLICTFEKFSYSSLAEAIYSISIDRRRFSPKIIVDQSRESALSFLLNFDN